MMKHKLFLLVLVILALGCKEKFTPKPRGFFRISFPEKKYQPIENQFPYQFNIPQYVQVVPDYQNPGQLWWINLEVPENKAEVHISYYSLQNNTKPAREMLAEFMEESRELAYKHSVKANAIEERIFVNPEDNVFGTVYRIEGNAASPIQFFLTDSTRHFLRGALYIRATPDIDSLKPVIEFLERDVVQIIETTKWK
jgi:gliding motility-associated lipoprotein GldD